MSIYWNYADRIEAGDAIGIFLTINIIFLINIIVMALRYSYYTFTFAVLVEKYNTIVFFLFSLFVIFPSDSSIEGMSPSRGNLHQLSAGNYSVKLCV